MKVKKVFLLKEDEKASFLAAVYSAPSMIKMTKLEAEIQIISKIVNLRLY